MLKQFCPTAPPFKEENLGDLSGKVYMVTGSNTGVGKELAQILYGKNATVYMATRTESRAKAAIASIQAAFPASTGRLVFLPLDLADLTTVKPAVDAFLRQESQLHVLYNNAGVMFPPAGAKTKQGYELQLGTNCLGHFLLTKLLTPTLVATAKTAPKDSVRVIWVSSSGAEGLSASKDGGFYMDNLDYHNDKSTYYKYGVSKAGNFYHATEYARRYGAGAAGIVSIALHPGILNSELARNAKVMAFLLRPMLHPPKSGAYTELFAGMAPDVTAARVQKGDNWILPFGTFDAIRADMQKAAKPESEGGTGLAQKYWQWSEDQVKAYA